MTDHVVSVRMPKSLVTALKERAEKDHFLDVSEQIRSVIRKEWNRQQDPYEAHLVTIKEEMAKHKVPKKVKALRKDLKKILEELNEL